MGRGANVDFSLEGGFRLAGLKFLTSPFSNHPCKIVYYSRGGSLNFQVLKISNVFDQILFVQILLVTIGKFATVGYAVGNYVTDGLFAGISCTIHTEVSLKINNMKILVLEKTSAHLVMVAMIVMIMVCVSHPRFVGYYL